MSYKGLPDLPCPSLPPPFHLLPHNVATVVFFSKLVLTSGLLCLQCPPSPEVHVTGCFSPFHFQLRNASPESWVGGIEWDETHFVQWTWTTFKALNGFRDTLLCQSTQPFSRP